MKINFIIVISLLLSNGSAVAHHIGTLFYSPDERAALLAARNGTTPVNTYTINGIIQRAQGKSAVWINGHAILQPASDPLISTLEIRREHVLIEKNPIKVGETLDLISGQRILPIPDNAVRVRP